MLSIIEKLCTDGMANSQQARQQVKNNDARTRYSFDANSNRTSIDQIAAGGVQTNTASYSYDPANANSPGLDQLTSVTQAGVTTSMVYDTEGRLTSRKQGAVTTQALTWDGEEGLSGVTQGSTTLSYTRDPLGRIRTRVQNTPALTTSYAYAGGENVYELSGTGAPATVNSTQVAGPAGDVASYPGEPTAGATATYRYYSARGDLVATASTTGVRQGAALTYTPFGGPEQGVTANKAEERFLGRHDKKTDAVSTLVEMGARQYDPGLGRFITVDPIEGGQANNYDYAFQDPINQLDLTGLGCGGACWLVDVFWSAKDGTVAVGQAIGSAGQAAGEGAWRLIKRCGAGAGLGFAIDAAGLNDAQKSAKAARNEALANGATKAEGRAAYKAAGKASVKGALKAVRIVPGWGTALGIAGGCAVGG